MVTPPEPVSSSNQYSPMSKPNTTTSSSSRNRANCQNDTVPYVAASVFAFLVLWSLWSYAAPNLSLNPSSPLKTTTSITKPTPRKTDPEIDMGYDPPEEKTFYDDPELSYSVEKRISNWDEKRTEWMKAHPSFAPGSRDRVVMVTGSQSKPCKNPVGDHLLLRFFKNKVDYARRHDYDIFYNNVLVHPKMNSFWAKLPIVKAAMLAHPGAEWIWWIDSDAAITDMEFKLPLRRYDYKRHNLVVHGWEKLIFDSENPSWTALNAGIFLIRNCQWSMDFIYRWAHMGPISRDHAKWGHLQKATVPDKLYPGSDDQTALVYIIFKDRRLTDKIYLEGEYYFEGYWLEIVPTYENITGKYMEMERNDALLRRRHAEKVSEQYGVFREPHLKRAGNGKGSWRRPFITHFTGCQPCSGDHNQQYGADTCYNGMSKALNFADNQVLRNYGFVHPDLIDSSIVTETPFDYPDEGPW